MSEARVRVGVVGATGVVGREVVALLAERDFPVAVLHAWASAASAGEEIELGEESCRVEPLPATFPALDVVFLCAPAEVAAPLGPALSAAGAIVIDLSRCPASLGPVAKADPRPTASRGVVLPILPPLARMIVSPVAALAELSAPTRITATYLVSAAAFGRRALDRLSARTIALLNARDETDEEETEPPAEIAFNVLPDVSSSSWARRIEDEVRAALDLDLPVSVALARVPSFHAHALSLALETREPIAVERAVASLRRAPSLLVVEPDEASFGTLDAVGDDALYAAGLRADRRDARTIHAWLVADAIRWGAALPAVSLAEKALALRG